MQTTAKAFDDILNLNTTYRLIERHTRQSLSNALSYMNADRSKHGGEDYKKKWFRDMDVLSWALPFFRHVDGRDHTHFVLDIDVRLKEDESKYEKYPDKLRDIKIAASMEYFGNWIADHPQHEFLWKVGATGLHAIQRIDKKIDREKLVPLVNLLFPKCDKNKLQDKERIDPAVYKKAMANHRCSFRCYGWHFFYNKNNKTMMYDRSKLQWSKYYKFKDTIVRFIIDLNYINYQRRMIRWVYSPVFKIPQQTFFSIPILEWDFEWVKKHSVLKYMKEILQPFEIPQFSFDEIINLDEIDEDQWIEERTPNISTGKGPDLSKRHPAYLAVKLYEPEDEHLIPPALSRIMDRMTNEFHKESCSPCMQEHYLISSGQKSIFWNRFMVVRYLYLQNYSLTHLANWIRFRLNDNEDNNKTNRHKLMTYLPEVIGNPDRPNPLPRCTTLQSSSSDYYICNEEMQMKCGRSYPLETRKLKSSTQYVQIDTSLVEEKTKFRDVNPIAIVEGNVPTTPKMIDKHWDEIVNKIEEVLRSRNNLVLWKSTRAGVTTTMIFAAKKLKKKLMVLVPTNKIALETFEKALNISRSKLGVDINGAVLGSNTKSCLILKMTERELKKKKMANPQWGNKRLAWNKLIYHTKPSCKGCRYKNSIANLPLYRPSGDITPLYDSKVQDYEDRTGWCAYQTFKRHLRDFDVVFLTYAKLRSLRTAESDENKDVLKTLMTEFDICFLDEINTVAQSSGLVVRVISNRVQPNRTDEKLSYDYFSYLREELVKLVDYSTNPKTTEKIVHMIEKFIRRFEPYKIRDWSENNIIRHDTYDVIKDGATDPLMNHPLDYAERENLRENFGMYHMILENYTKETNELFYSIERVLLLLSNDEFVGYNLPRFGSPFLDYYFVVSPNIREIRGFIKDFIRNKMGNRIIATDACLPEANISDLLDIRFEDYVVGDPRQTNKHQLIVADTHQIFTNKFLKGHGCKDIACEYWNTNDNECKLVLNYSYNKDGRDIVIQESAFNNGWSSKNKFMFLRDLQGVIDTFKAEKVFVILANKAAYSWFRKNIYKLNNAKKLKFTYYRSDLTIGVECDRRIMVTLGTPIPPRNSYLWLAYYYHQMGLMRDKTMNEVAERLRVNSMRSSFWQTAGRAKDPLGIERSVVFAWGLGSESLIDAFQFHERMRDSLPRYKAISTQKEFKASDLITCGTAWRRHGIIIDFQMIHLSEYLSTPDKVEKWFTSREIYQKNRFPPEKIAEFKKSYTKRQLSSFNLEIEEAEWGARKRYRVRSTMPLSKFQQKRVN